MRAPLYFASYEQVFSGAGRVVLFRAPSQALAEQIARESKEKGELLSNLNLANFVEGVPVEFLNLQWEPKKDYYKHAKDHKKHRTVRITRSRD